MKKINVNELFIFEMANNHMGDVEHGKRIISEMIDISKRHGIRGGVKFQFRNIDTFIHPDFINNAEVPHIKRFVETRLNKDDYHEMINAVLEGNLIPIGTAFDEDSLKIMLELGIKIIKVASCSALDRPLLDEISKTGYPIIVSTAGLNINQIDRLVSYLSVKKVDFSLMHCTAIYPTPIEKLRLNQIKLMKERYPELVIGFSTHEHPVNYMAVQIAYANGARIFEKHVGIKTDKYSINSYSATPEQIEKWIESYKIAKSMNAGGDERPPAFPEEIDSLNSLKRGVYVNKNLKKGELIKREDVFFAMPLQRHQIKSEKWILSGFKADKDYLANAPLPSELAPFDYEEGENFIFQIILQLKGVLNNAKIPLGSNSSIEISHHFGIEKFRDIGAIIIEVINSKKYCKKLIVQLPRQKHPYHFHKKKDETFQLHYGDLEIFLEGEKTKLRVGDTIHVPQKTWHKFQTLDGSVVEEISTRHFNDDSFYEDERITSIPREKRKTKIPNWESVLVDKL